MRCQPLIESDRVEGTTVMIRRERIIGSIKRLMIEKISGRVAYSVMSFGGFLGMGTEEHSIPWNKLTYDTRLGDYRTDITEQQLRGAPAFSRDRNYEWTDRIENASCTTPMVRHTTGDPRSPKQELALASVRWIASAWHHHG